MSERPHGYNRYRTDRCRCLTCCLAKSAYEKRRIAGAVPGYVNAAPAAEHLRMLRAAGYGTRRLSELTGVSRVTLQRLGRGPLTVHAHTASLILAVPVAGPAPSARHIPAHGTRRRLQALQAIGWSVRAQAASIGMTGPNVRRIMVNPAVEPSTAEKVRRVYDTLSMRLPAETGWTRRIRAYARAERWFPPLAWDDDHLDDPDPLPCLLPPVAPVDRELELAVQHLAAGHDVTITGPLRLEVIRRTPDRSTKELARMLGCSKSHVDTTRRELAATC